MRLLLAALLSSALLVVDAAQAGTFFGPTDANNGVISHPIGYTGSGGNLTLDVCIVTGSPNASMMTVPVQAAVATWNALTPIDATDSNLDFGGTPSGSIDFESVVLHELGHCALALNHSNLATESGVPSSNQDYTKTGNGSNGTYDFAVGPDGVRGTGDDSRGDDINFHWFKMADNHPFSALPATVEPCLSSSDGSCTYSVFSNHLPAGDTFAANGSRAVASSLGLGSDIEAVMNQGTNNQETQRQLTADDVATAKLAMAGTDRTQGTADDYSYTLNFIGQANDCDVPIAFDDSKTSFAICNADSVRVAPLDPNHRVLISSEIFFNAGFNWHFSEGCGDGVLGSGESCDDGGFALADGCDPGCQVESGWICAGEPSSCSALCGDGALDAGEECDDGGAEPGDGCDESCLLEGGWSCAGTPAVCGPICGDGVSVGSEQCDPPGACCDAFCMFDPVGLSCSDGNACTSPGSCDGGGSCDPGAPLGCDDGDECTADSCDAVSGCLNEPILDCGEAIPASPLWTRLLLLAVLMGAGVWTLVQVAAVRRA